MRTYTYIVTLLLWTSSFAHGGLIQIWSFQQLFDEADVVMIASIKEPTKRVGTAESWQIGFHGTKFFLA